ncbi:MAG: DUF882 domain-containing protein [Alphaproteobacteria bacterium]|nr:DUF882 domain-containing protein [Alphaproteobacteria bacterium]
MTIHRRQILAGLGAVTLLSFGGFPAVARATTPKSTPKSLKLVNLHTGERFHGEFFEKDYLPDAIAELKHVLRDFRTGDAHDMDPRLYDWMASLHKRLGGGEFSIISGYRSPATNRMLRATSSGVAKKSKHMEGRAIDLRMAGVELADIRKMAMADRRGGVGFYPKSDFVHIDTGRPRSW